MISEMLEKNMLKFGAIKVFPNGLASVQDGIEYMKSGKVRQSHRSILHAAQ